MPTISGTFVLPLHAIDMAIRMIDSQEEYEMQLPNGKKYKVKAKAYTRIDNELIIDIDGREVF